MAHRLGDPPALHGRDPGEQTLRVGTIAAGKVLVEPVEETGHVCCRDPVAAPEARSGLEVPHPGLAGDLLEPLVADLGVDRIGRAVVGVDDHRLE